ncbi:hypothetical protein FVE85_0226 [Porphyridium purpureum]|uniref:Alpha/beta hydrolase fold-5 domain-containing protein n=1 Tax=Porphyridium purpureum TaxID=35688 RepID=A0A5J4Z1E2_PORPP|nr:hypothetical protein FVE85_0226 [Porphyridium purpureum]|eukprot:POR8499..scf208_2
MGTEQAGCGTAPWGCAAQAGVPLVIMLCLFLALALYFSLQVATPTRSRASLGKTDGEGDESAGVYDYEARRALVRRNARALLLVQGAVFVLSFPLIVVHRWLKTRPALTLMQVARDGLRCAISIVTATPQKATPGVQGSLFSGEDSTCIRRTEEYILVYDDSAPAFTHGVVLLTGYLVDADAALPLARLLARGGIAVGVCRFPYAIPVDGSLVYFTMQSMRKALADRMAVSTSDKNREPFEFTLLVHSAGILAAIDSLRNRQVVAQIHGIVSMGCKPRQKIIDRGIKYLAIVGSHDAWASPQDFIKWMEADHEQRMPAKTAMTILPGANHRQFLSYEFQPWDLPASMDEAQQLQEVASIVHAFVAQV